MRTYEIRKNIVGFTLIELLVVIAIIGILATLVAVNIRDARLRSQNSGAKSDITQIGKAIETFRQVRNSGGEGVLVSDPVNYSGVFGAGSELRWNTTTNQWQILGYWSRFAGEEYMVNPAYRYEGIAVIKAAGKQHSYKYATSPDYSYGGYDCRAEFPCARFYCLATNQVATSDNPAPKAFAIRNGVAVDLLQADVANWYRVVGDSNPIVCD